MMLASRTWLGALKVIGIPTELNRDLCLWLTVASVFPGTEIFKLLTRIVLHENEGAFEGGLKVLSLEEELQKKERARARYICK
jgi:hypothetical protein